MSKQKLFLNIIGAGVFAAVLMGCASPAPAQAPVVDFEKTIEVVKTQAAGTAVANFTPVVCALTSTSVPTATNTTPPTITPTLKATHTLMPWWTKTPTQSSGGCTVTDSSPKPNEVVAPNGSFDGKWVIKNTGDGKWLSNEMDIRYATGTKFQTKVDVLDMKTDVAEGDSYTVIVDMKAPSAAGTYATTWVVYKGGQIICSMPLTIVVQ
jgi:hypothetical protein